MMTHTRARRVPMLLQPADYEALEAIAQREERTPTQQAAWIVRRALAASVPQDDNTSGELVGAGAVARIEEPQSAA